MAVHQLLVTPRLDNIRVGTIHITDKQPPTKKESRMAMIQCRECNAEISDKAAACPKCGAELAKGKTRGALKTIVFVGVILVVAFFAMDAMFSTNKRERADFEQSLDRSHNAMRELDRLKKP